MTETSILLQVSVWWWSWFGPACIQVGLAILVISCLSRCAPTIPSRLRSLLWRLAHLKLPLVLLWPAAFSITLPALMPASPDSVGAAMTATALEAAPAAQSSIGLDFASLLVVGSLLWCLGVIWQVVGLVRGCLRARAIRERSISCEDAELHRLVSELAAKFGCRRRPDVRFAPGISSPLLLGLHRPTLVLPRDAAALSGIRALLAHEIAHLRRRDIEWKLAEFAVRTILWPLPLMWWARRESEIAAEESCDALALDVTQDTTLKYAQLLIELATRSTQLRAVTAVGATSGAISLRRRFATLERRLARSPRSNWLVGAAIACAIAVAAPLSLGARVQEPASRTSLVTDAAISVSAEANDTRRIQLFRRDRDGGSMQIVLTPDDPGLSAIVEHEGRPSAHYRFGSLDELAPRDVAAYEFVLNSVRRTPERNWLFDAK